MQSLLLAVDRFSALVGKTFAWSIVLLVMVICYEVLVRYAFRAPTTWAYDASVQLYGLLFMMAGAYALSRNGHVRGDFLYRRWRPRIQAGLDLALYLLAFFPAMIAFMVQGWTFFHESYLQNEHSPWSPEGPIIWPFKFLIPLTGALLCVQGLAETARCVICLSTGQWPQRLHDVEELEKLVLERAASEQDKEAAAATVAEAEASRRGNI